MERQRRAEQESRERVTMPIVHQPEENQHFAPNPTSAESTRFDWLSKYKQEVEYAIRGDSNGRGESCNLTKKIPTPCACKPKNSLGWSQMHQEYPKYQFAHYPNKQLDLKSFLPSKVLFWIPELFFNQLIKHAPCPEGECTGSTTGEGWMVCFCD